MSIKTTCIANRNLLYLTSYFILKTERALPSNIVFKDVARRTVSDNRRNVSLGICLVCRCCRPSRIQCRQRIRSHLLISSVDRFDNLTTCQDKCLKASWLWSEKNAPLKILFMLAWELMMGYPGVRLSWHLFIPRVPGSPGLTWAPLGTLGTRQTSGEWEQPERPGLPSSPVVRPSSPSGLWSIAATGGGGSQTGRAGAWQELKPTSGHSSSSWSSETDRSDRWRERT